MKAAVLNRPDGRFDVEDITIDPPIDREVPVQVKACGLWHSDLHLAQANHGTALPAVPGHEVAGIVIEIGPGVRDFAVGDVPRGTAIAGGI
ncbi:MAG: alcohol dehydrogenase catalytic domain-containing protein [Bosea sp.]|nr:alcohol dehydrogenase catalytic domain-containing protein [Bosea sp. (in: a-proteobacteria)]